MKNSMLEILHEFRSIICLPILLAIGIITAPLTILFRWQGFWILSIANAESCSLSKAKKIFQDKMKYSNIGKNSNSESLESFPDHVYSPTYSYLPCNLYHNKSIKDD